MAKVKQIKLRIGSGDPVNLELGDLCAEDFKDISRPKASVKSCVACLNAILDIIQGPEESSDQA